MNRIETLHVSIMYYDITTFEIYTPVYTMITKQLFSEPLVIIIIFVAIDQN